MTEKKKKKKKKKHGMGEEKQWTGESVGHCSNSIGNSMLVFWLRTDEFIR